MNYPSNPISWIGRSLGDRQRYRLEKRLGGGGMGDVFLAMDTRMGKQVALKLLKDSLVSYQEMRKRFEREVEISAALNSKHIVEVTDYGVTDEGYPFYVMEYLRGESLRQLLQRQKRLSVEKAVKIVTQTCLGLQHAHKGVTLWREGGTISEHIQVVHRDLKPDNIFLESTEAGELVKIVDFGIAKIRSDSFEQTSLTHTFIGTFRYASPEQLRGEINLDGRADIYSLGIILYEMLSANDPFGFSMKARHHSESSWIFAHTSEPPQPLRSQPGCENLSAQLEAVVMRCLQKKPSDRFASVEQLHHALESITSLKINHVTKEVREETIAHLPQVNTEFCYDSTIPHPLNVVHIQPQKITPQHLHVINPLNLKKEQKHAKIIPAPNPQASPNLETKLIPNRQQVSVKERIQPPEIIIAEPKKKLSLTPIVSTSLISVACISGFFAYPLITSMLTLKSIKSAEAKSNYQECIAISEKVPPGSSIYTEIIGIIANCRVKYATNLAAKNQCNEATQIVEKIPPENPIFEKARTKIDKLCNVNDRLFSSPK